MPSTNSVKVSIGKESTAGTPVATTAVVPIKSLPGVDRSIEKATDPVIVGAGMASGEYPVSASVKGPLSLAPRSCPGFGQILKGTFGAEASPEQIIGLVRLRYTGSSASCKITGATTTLNAKIGALAAESNDSAFGTSGTISLVAAANDTPAELVALIDGYADYEAKLVTGSGASTITGIMAVTAQAKGGWVLLVLTGTASGAYAHQFTADLVAGNERPTFSVQVDGFQDNIKFAGCSVNSLNLSAALKAALEGDCELVGFTEAIGQSVMSALSLNDSKPFIFGGGIVSISGVDYNFVRSVSAKVENNLKDDGYGQSSLDRAYHAKGLFALSGDLKLRLDATSYLERAKVESGVVAPIFLYFYAAESKKVGTSSVAEMLIIEVPFAELSAFTFEDNSGIVDCGVTWKAYNPGGTIYNPPVTVTLISADSAAY